MYLSLSNIIILFVCAVGIYTTTLFYISFFDNSRRIKDPKPPKILPTVAICVPFYNEKKGTIYSIESLLALDYPAEKLQIIAVDDGSSDNSYDIIKKYVKEKGYKNVIVLRHDKNKGKHEAVNTAIKHSDSDIFGVLDADSYVESDALMNMVGYFKNKEVVAVTPSMKVWPKGSILQRVQEVEYLLGVWLRKVFSYMDTIHVTPGPFSIFKRKFFNKYGIYRESHKTEDIEMALRIQSNNYRIENSINAHVYTSGPKKLKILNKQRLRWYSGFIKNTLDYKHLFGKKYGNLGLVFLPLAYLSVFIVLGTLFYHLFKAIINSYDQVKVAILSNFDIFRWSFNFDTFFMNLGPVALLGIVSTLLLLVILYHTLIISKKRENTLFFSIICFIFIYYFLYAYWWLSSIFSVVTKKKVPWGHKSGSI